MGEPSADTITTATRRGRCVAKRAEDQRRHRELAQAFDEAIRLLMQAKVDSVRYVDSHGGVTGFSHLVVSDLEDARAAIDDIQERLMNL